MTDPTSRPMRMLVVATQEPWPLDHGGRLRLFHFVRRLAQVAEVTLALPGVAEHADRLPENVHVEAMSPGRRGAPASESAARHASWTTRLARRHFGYNTAVDLWLQRNARPARFDVAFFAGAVLGVHLPSASVPVVWDGVDELVLYALRGLSHRSWRHWPRTMRQALLYALYERDAAHGAAVTTFTSTVDAACARRWTGQSRVEVVSNGVDLDYFHPSRSAPRPGTIAFVGSLEFPPNVDGIIHFATRIWPRIYAGGTSRRLLVVGRRPAASVKALTSLPGVELACDVPDVRPYLARASAVIVPTRLGGGVKNKILEACAARRPVVASSRALGGLSARAGIEVLRADKPHAWLARVGRLLDQPDYARRVAHAGHDWVRREHRWSTLGDRLFGILNSARHPARGTRDRRRALCH